MVLGNKIRKLLVLITLSILFIFLKTNKVLADSKLNLNTNKQIQFLEEKRISQGVILKEKQKNAIIEGMLTSKDVENKRNAEIEKERKTKESQRNRRDTFSEIVKSVRKLQSRKRETIPRNFINPKSKAQVERISLSETPVNMLGQTREIPGGNSLVGQLEVIRDLIDKPISKGEPVDMSPRDIEMLERIVMAESGGEPYLGQIAVTNVVLNRLKSSRYPSTLKGVIFQKSQFSPVKNGVIRGSDPNESVKKAVAEALNGRRIVSEDTLYFVNPVLATDQTIPRTKKPVKVIGSHTFYK